jgi:hypothetical protein
LANDSLGLPGAVVELLTDVLLALREAAKRGPSEGSRTHPEAHAEITGDRVLGEGRAAQRSSLPYGPTAV